MVAKRTVLFGIRPAFYLLAERVRPFAELQPAATLLYGEPVFGLKARAGVTVYF